MPQTLAQRALAALLLVASASAALVCDDADGCLLSNTDVVATSAAETLAQPTEASDTTISLSVDECTVTIINFGKFNSRCYCYGVEGCKLTGPTLKMTQGSTVSVTLTNNMDTETSTNPEEMNTMHNPQSTNLHTHGLHVDPAVDSIFVHMAPGESHTYKYEIPSTHHPGFHWYHSHQHGTSTMQVMGGLVGGVMIEPADAAADIPAAMIAMDRVTMVLQHLSITNDDTSTDPFTVWTLETLKAETGATASWDAEFAHADLTDIYTVNGQYQPKLDMVPGEWKLFDIVNACGDRIVELEINDELKTIDVGDPTTSTVSSSCSTYLIATDGVYLETPRTGDHVNHLVIIQGQRVTIAVKCSEAGEYLFQSAYSSNVMNYEVATIQNLVTLVVAGSSATMAGPDDSSWDQSQIPKPWYYDITPSQVNAASPLSVSVEQTGCCGDDTDTGSPQYWLGIGSDCSLACFGRNDCDVLCTTGACTDGTSQCDGSDKYGTCDGTDWAGVQSYDGCSYKSFDGAQGSSGSYSFTAEVGQIAEVVFNGRGKAPHPMHIHVNHFQFVNFTNDKGITATEGWYGVAGDWRDTFPAMAGAVHALTAFADFSGEIVMHCHFLKHEDLGMMDTFYVASTNSTNSPQTPTTAAPTTSAVEECAAGEDDTGKVCPPDTTNGPCPAGCEAETSSLMEDKWAEI